jgi:ankyrin repeat protein
MHPRRPWRARILVDHGATRMTARDEYGSTPLHRASKCGHVDLAQFLVEHGGANVSAKDKDRATPSPLHSIVRRSVVKT